jgi:hypothetical protein
MDDIVKKAMAKWPNVPDCYGWLALDMRGQWLMRDEKTQEAGAFQSGTAGSKGSVLHHEKLIEFIARNYACDDQGQWFFQNGPQRVFIELELTPIIWRVNGNLEISSHTGWQSELKACLEDESGRVYLQTPLGLGLVHSMDVVHVAQAIEQGIWSIANCKSDELPKIHGYVMSPQARLKEQQT